MNAVLHFTEVPIEPGKYYPDAEVKKLMVTRTGFRKMATYIYKKVKGVRVSLNIAQFNFTLTP